ncbi:Hypothetical_protein [Hexamita inflata]|uniref:Hypothetical_protein n=1 Tax=Hexamita inflata TaxID=28002 RepID=A0ABP1KR44_9EUKA
MPSLLDNSVLRPLYQLDYTLLIIGYTQCGCILELVQMKCGMWNMYTVAQMQYIIRSKVNTFNKVQYLFGTIVQQKYFNTFLMYILYKITVTSYLWLISSRGRLHKTKRSSKPIRRSDKTPTLCNSSIRRIGVCYRETAWPHAVDSGAPELTSQLRYKVVIPRLAIAVTSSGKLAREVNLLHLNDYYIINMKQ